MQVRLRVLVQSSVLTNAHDAHETYHAHDVNMLTLRTMPTVLAMPGQAALELLDDSRSFRALVCDFQMLCRATAPPPREAMQTTYFII